MQREILFRGKGFDNGKWYGSMTLGSGTIKRKRDWFFLEVLEDKWIRVDPKTIGQYTEHTDCDCKGIFEGDICMIEWAEVGCDLPSDFIGVVEYLECCYWVSNGIDTARLFDELISWKIIGNIHDNPELLE